MSKNSRKNAKTKRIIAGFLSIILIITMIFPAYPIKAVENDATIYLSTPEDLIDLSKNCVYDTYADGKRVVLKNDLDMTGYELEPLAIFGGTFEGNNYSIKGLSFQNVGSNKGLFGVIKESGMISNLCVEVWIEPTGSKSNLGGIAGTNQGKIYNCIVNGKIKGEETVGGIVGNNTQTGLISGCSNYAKITGNQYNGGIAGKNYGSIFNCTNYATVNEEENAKAQDTGGIAGISYGEIEQCVNEADIGYLHTGYNVGGIVGRQNGHVMDSVNHGNIYGRKDVGGIVGQFEPYTTIVYEEDIFQEMERKVTEVTDRMNEVLNEAEVALQEIGTNPEEDIVFIGKESLKSTAYIKANIESCNNQGSVKAKNSYAGGIVGRADMGTLRDDKNTGTVETTNGSFNGGIAGSSNGLITSCYAISDLIGNDDMGGIAGKACDIDHSYSMVRITSEGERIGAIAGSVSGIASQNFFVKENLQGVNGINYEGSAMPLEYQDFITSSNLPEEFKKLKVCFYTDNTLLKTVFVDYEGSIAQEDIPTIPDKDGLFAKWEDFDHNSIIRNINVHAVYSNWTSTISTGEEKPKLLLEGEFHPNTTITLTDIMQEEVGIEIPEGYSLSEAYSFLVHSPIEHKNDKIKVHILSDLEEKSAKIGMLTENGLILRNCEKEGSYLIFDMEDIGEFLILEKKTNPLPFLFIACAGAIGVGIIVRIIYKKKRKKK